MSTSTEGTSSTVDVGSDLTAANIAWDLEPLLAGQTVEELLQRAEALAAELAGLRGTVEKMDAAALAKAMHRFADLQDVLGRAGSYSSLGFATNSLDATRGALAQKVQERATAIGNTLLFFDLEWAALADGRVDMLLVDPLLEFCAHHLRGERRYRPHLLSEPEEKMLSEKSVTGRNAWARLFGELISAIEVPLPNGAVKLEAVKLEAVKLEEGLARLSHPDRAVRAEAAG